MRDFESGDLIYGLKQSRKPFIQNAQDRSGSEVITADNMNAWLDKDLPPEGEMPAQAKSFEKYLKKKKISTDDGDYDEPKEKFTSLCKGAMDFTAKKKKTVRFCLGGIDMDSVAKRPPIPSERSVTESELRHAYRAYQGSDSVQYYDGAGGSVDAPWVSDPTFKDKFEESPEKRSEEEE